MENNVKDFCEVGETMAVFAGKYLGCGKAVMSLKPLWHELRRDEFMPPESKQLRKLNFSIALVLSSGDRLWEALSDLDKSVFTAGSVLQLFPLDCRRKGYEFARSFFAGAVHSFNRDLAFGSVELTFDCETSDGSSGLFKRLPENSRPENLPEMVMPDLKDLLRTVGILLAEKTDTVFDHTLCLNYFAPDPRGSCSLELEKCREWNSNMCCVFDLRLTARYPVSEKFFVEQKLYDTAQFLHGFILESNENTHLLCSVKDLDFSATHNVAGKIFTNSIMRFALTML